MIWTLLRDFSPESATMSSSQKEASRFFLLQEVAERAKGIAARLVRVGLLAGTAQLGLQHAPRQPGHVRNELGIGSGPLDKERNRRSFAARSIRAGGVAGEPDYRPAA